MCRRGACCRLLNIGFRQLKLRSLALLLHRLQLQLGEFKPSRLNCTTSLNALSKCKENLAYWLVEPKDERYYKRDPKERLKQRYEGRERYEVLEHVVCDA